MPVRWTRRLIGTALLLLLPLRGQPAEQVRLAVEHVDLQVVYQPEDPTNKWALVVRDDDLNVAYRSNEVALVVAEAARRELTGDFPPFGKAGDSIWILPQSQDPQLLFLGLSAAGIPNHLLQTPFELYLRAVDGPGEFFAWQAGWGGLDIRINSHDGLDETDRLPVDPGSHSHWNFGFTTNGVYHLVFEVLGRRAGVDTNDFSLPTPIRFEVEPLPPKPERPFVLWQQAHWPGEADLAVIGPEADPDGDRRPNRLEYAYGFDPKTPDGDGTPSIRLVPLEGALVAEITHRRNKAATDVAFELESAPAPTGPWKPVSALAQTADQGTYERVTWRDRAAVDSATARFYRLQVRLIP